MEREASELAQAAARHPEPARPERSGGILDQVHVRRDRVLELLPVERPAEQVHADHRLRPWRDGVVDLAEVEVHGLRVDVGEHRFGTDERDDVGGRRERVGGDDHLVALADPERKHREVERGGPVRDADRVLAAADTRELRLELSELRAHRQAARLEHLRDRLDLLRPDIGPGEPDQAAASPRLRYHEIVRPRPSSSSTFASKPSTSRALSTFGIRSSTSA